jgi:hypothetical protein
VEPIGKGQRVTWFRWSGGPYFAPEFIPQLEEEAFRGLPGETGLRFLKSLQERPYKALSGFH